MRTAAGILLLFFICVSVQAEEGEISASITDVYDMEMKLDNVKLVKQMPPDSAVKTVTLDRVPLEADGKPVNLWIAQIKKSNWKRAGNAIEIKAVLQGKGAEEVTGKLKNPENYSFEGVMADGPRKGNKARFAATEVKTLKILTPYEGAEEEGGETSDILPMPTPDEDVLWVSSVPVGAEVFTKPKDAKDTEYKNVGHTPFKMELKPGTYSVRVFVPAEVGKLTPSTKLGEDTNPFEPDGWISVNFQRHQNVVESMNYEVTKPEKGPATLIALFQRKGAPLKEVVAGFPKGSNFKFVDKKVEGSLLNNGIAKTDVPLLLEALHRGGKIVWHGDTKTLIIELQPGERGWKITKL